MTGRVQLMHDLWLILTLVALFGWGGLALRVRNVFLPLHRTLRPAYRVLMWAAVAVGGTQFEMLCAELAAAVYTPGGISAENVTVRLTGRAAQAAAVLAAWVASLVIEIKVPESDVRR